MSVESLDTLRQQGFPLSSTEFGLSANLGGEAHGRRDECYDRCVQGGFQTSAERFSSDDAVDVLD
eukprot:4097683-Amphidinium_carterae.1